MTPSPTDIAWVAGLFEGEGCWTLKRRSKRGIEYAYAGAALTTTDEDVLRRFAEIVGRGGVSEQARRGPEHWKRQWKWQVQSRSDFAHFAALVEPYLGERRRSRLVEIRRAASSARPRLPREFCKRGHRLSGRNAKPMGRGRVTCRTCVNARARARYASRA